LIVLKERFLQDGLERRGFKEIGFLNEVAEVVRTGIDMGNQLSCKNGFNVLFSKATLNVKRRLRMSRNLQAMLV